MAELTAYQPASSVADPSLTVTGRDDGGGYTVAAGARSLSISTDAGATLLTTVKDQDNAAVTVTGPTTTTPSWTAPAGSTTGAGCCVTVTSTVGSVSSQVSFIEHVDGSGGGGAYSWTVVESNDLTDGNVTSGSTSTPGAFTIYESDGTTPRITGTFLSPAGATGTISWDSTGVNVACTGGSGAIYAIFDAPNGSLTDEERDWHVDVILKPGTVPSGDILLCTLGNNQNPGTGTSVGIDVQNTSGTYDIEIRRTSAGVTYGLQELPGALPTSISGRLESRGGDSCWVYWNSAGTAYLNDANSDATGGGKAHGAPGGIDSASLWNGAAYIGLGCTAGADVKIEKWRTRELA